MPFAIMKAWHPMIGLDLHIPWPPGSPAPLPSPVPYRTGLPLFGLGGLTAKYCTTYMNAGFGTTMVKGTDIGPMIPHVGPPSVTLPPEMIASGSKSYFGSSMHKCMDQTNSPGCICCAALVMVNPNLNCGTPAPTPTGFVMAINTHFTEMTVGDILGGLLQMGVDAALQIIMNKVGDKMTGELAAAFPGLTAAISKPLLGLAVGMFVGTPLGMSASNFGLPTVISGMPVTADSGNAAGQALDNYLNAPTTVDLGSGQTNPNTPAPAPGQSPAHTPPPSAAAPPTDAGVPPAAGTPSPEGGAPPSGAGSGSESGSPSDPQDAGAPPQDASQ